MPKYKRFSLLLFTFLAKKYILVKDVVVEPGEIAVIVLSSLVSIYLSSLSISLCLSICISVSVYQSICISICLPVCILLISDHSPMCYGSYLTDILGRNAEASH